MTRPADAVAQLLARGAHRDLTQVLMHPVLAQSLDQVCGNWSLSVFHRNLYEPFERARQLNAHLTFREFILSGGVSKHVLRALLGEDGYLLTVLHSGPEYFAARARMLAAPRTQRSRLPQWLAWGHWASTPPNLDLTGRTRILPVDFPVFGRAPDGTRRWVYPEWNTGRGRLFQNLAYVELMRRLGPQTQIPLGGGAPALLRALNLPHNPTAAPFTGVSGLRMTNLQVARMLQTGQSPSHRAVLLTATQDPPPGFARSPAGRGGRASTDARWELASRFGNPELVNAAYFQREIGKYPLATDTNPPNIPPNPTDPVASLSNAELVAMGRWDHNCWAVGYDAYQVDHIRGQRAVGTLQDMLTELRQAIDTSLIAHLCGLCDPNNLRILTPQGHAAEDFFAYYVQSFGQWQVNTTRASLPYLLDPTQHPGYAKSLNVFISFSPYQLEPVAYMLRDLSVMQAVQSAPGSTQDAYNQLADGITAAMRGYQMDPGLMPMRYVNGVWR
jgi:hypothetical protein